MAGRVSLYARLAAAIAAVVTGLRAEIAINHNKWQEFVCDCNRVVFGRATHDEKFR